MVLEEAIVAVDNYDMFPSPYDVKDVVSCGHWSRDIFYLIIDRPIVYEESDIVLCEEMFGSVFCSILPFKEGWTAGLYCDA